MAKGAKSKNIRALILAGADRLLARYGYSKMTMEDLAKEVGIGKGTVYLHFESKEAVALAHVDGIIERVLEQMNSIADSGLTWQEQLELMLLARVMIRYEAVRHYSAGLSDVLISLRAPLLERRAMHFAQEAATIAEMLKRQLAADHETEALSETASALITATNALLPYSLSPAELGNPSQVEEMVRNIARLLIRGVERALQASRAEADFARTFVTSNFDLGRRSRQ